MSKTIQMNSCPNPKCQKKFENLIIVHDNSQLPSDIYYACPHCLLKLDPLATQILKKEEIYVEEKGEDKTYVEEKGEDKTYVEEKGEDKTYVEEKGKDKIESKSTHLEKEIPPGCPQYFGYLSVRPKDSLIPQECLICLKMLDCTMKN